MTNIQIICAHLGLLFAISAFCAAYAGPRIGIAFLILTRSISAGTFLYRAGSLDKAWEIVSNDTRHELK